MVDVTPTRRVVIRVAKDQIKYIAGKVKYTYEQVVDKINEFLEFLREKIITDVKIWIDKYVPKRTGQLRHFLKEWIDGSTIGKNVLHIILGTYLPYASDVEAMSTAMVRHSGETGYVYYPNIFRVYGKVTLNDPEAVGKYFTKLIAYTEETAKLWISKAIAMSW